MSQLITTLGTLTADKVGMILPHEHIFVDLGPIEEENWKHADPGAVVDLMAPELERARDAGVSALVECTPMGVGRRAEIVKAVSVAANFPVVVPTGIYREPWVPVWAYDAPVEMITYTRDGNNRLWRSGEMVAEHISGFQLQYAVVDEVVGEDWVSKSAESAPAAGEKADNKPWDERDVRRITVTLAGDIQVSPKLGNKQRTLSSTITVRNIF